MNDAFPLIISNIIKHSQFSCWISALYYVPLFIDGFGCAVVPAETEVDLQLLRTKCVVNSDSTRDEQVKKSAGAEIGGRCRGCIPHQT